MREPQPPPVEDVPVGATITYPDGSSKTIKPEMVPSVVPAYVKRDELVEALLPLMQLLGIAGDDERTRLYSDPAVVIDFDSITMRLAGHVITEGTAQSVKIGDNDDFAEWGTEVKIMVMD